MKMNKEDIRLNARLSSWGLSRSERGGGGNCFWMCLGIELGIPYVDLRRQVAQHMRDHSEIYGLLGDFESYGGFLKYCDLVATPGFFAQGNSEMAAAADFAGKHIVVLGHDAEHDVVFFAGGLALGASVDLGGLEHAIYIAHWAEAAHYTGIIADIAWKKYSKRRSLQRDAAEAETGFMALSAIVARARGMHVAAVASAVAADASAVELTVLCVCVLVRNKLHLSSPADLIKKKKCIFKCM